MAFHLLFPNPMLLPLHLVATALLGLFSLAMLVAGLYALYRAFRNWRPRHYARVERPSRRLGTRQDPRPIVVQEVVAQPSVTEPAIMIPLAIGLVLAAFSFGGRHLIQYAFPAGDEPDTSRGGASQQLKGVGGADLRVETYGRPDGPALLFTHGWGMNSTEWFYAKRDLSDRFHLILWDLPGLGESTQPQDRDYALESLARDLRLVVATANGKPVVLVGHSIGGMINLTYCRLFPETLGREVAGIVQVDTSFTNPVETTKNSGVSQALQKPVAEPILYGMIGLSPLVHMMNWLSYENGTSHIMNAKSAFAGAETRGQLELVTRLQTEASPAVVARGTLAMFHWDATPVLPHINVPVLVLVGDQDTTTLPWASEYMRAHIPNAKLVVAAPAAHYSLLEQNKKIDSDIDQFATVFSR